jgi:hypothetical protein
MEWKDYAIIGLVILVIGAPIGVHVYHRGKGQLGKKPKETDESSATMTDDGRRLGTAISLYGGKTIAEGAKAVKRGSLRYHNDQEGKKQQQVGGA